jgi:hypothetical protein
MDRDEQAGQQSGQDRDPAELAGRRKFLRQVGMTAAAAAAAVGAAELAGLKPAAAAAKRKAVASSASSRGTARRKIVRPLVAGQAVRPDCEAGYDWCVCSEGNCDGGHCPHGYVCNWCFSGACGDFYTCIKGGCDYSEHLEPVCSLC